MSNVSLKGDPSSGCEDKACVYVSQEQPADMQGFLIVFVLLSVKKESLLGRGSYVYLFIIVINFFNRGTRD